MSNNILQHGYFILSTDFGPGDPLCSDWQFYDLPAGECGARYPNYPYEYAMPPRVSRLFRRSCFVHIILLFILCLCIPGQLHALDVRTIAERILNESGSKQGFAVDIRCGDGRLAMEILRRSKFTMHALETSDARVSRARETLVATEFYAKRISVERQVSPSRLPYPDYCANLIVMGDLGEQGLASVSWEEVLRVLMPERGLAYVGQADAKIGKDAFESTLRSAGLQNFEVFEKDGIWVKIRRPRPKGMGNWSHDLRGQPDNCRNVDDDLVRGPFHTAWLNVGQSFSKFGIPIAAEGYLITRSGGITGQPTHKNEIRAYDGYNGTLLWKSVLPKPDGIGLIAVDKRIFAIGERTLYALDIATGETIWTLDPSQIENGMKDWTYYACANGRLVVGLVDEEIQSTRTKRHVKPARIIAALEPMTGELKWKCSPNPGPLNYALGSGQVIFGLARNYLASLDIMTGEEVWRTQIGQSNRGLRFFDGKIFYGHTYDAATGKQIGRGEPRGRLSTLYTTTSSKTKTGTQLKIVNQSTGKEVGNVVRYHDPYDPKTGIPAGSWCYGRCIPTTFSKHCTFLSGNGTLILDLANARLFSAEAFRSNCRTGVVAGNGMVYNSPSGCGCNFSIRSGIGLAPVPLDLYEGEASSSPTHQLEKGAAYGETIEFEAIPSNWTGYRNDAARSNTCDAALGLPLRFNWSKKLGGELTPPSASGGRVFVGSTNHSVYALNQATGEVAWSFMTGGAIRVTPTWWNGRVYAGSEDGWVYALRADSGELIWRFRGAPHDRKLLNYGRVHSVWPVNGGVIAGEEGTIYFYAGYNSSDKMYLYALNGVTGEIIWSNDEAGFATNEENAATGVSPYGVSPSGVIAASEEMIYVPQGNSTPAGFRRKDGKLLWWKRRGDSAQRSNFNIQWLGGPELSYADGYVFVGGATSPRAQDFYSIDGKTGRGFGQDLARFFEHKAVGRDRKGNPINPKQSLWGIRPVSFGRDAAPVVYRDRIFTFRHRRTVFRNGLKDFRADFVKGTQTGPDPMEKSFGGGGILAVARNLVVTANGKKLVIQNLEDAKTLWSGSAACEGTVIKNGLAVTENRIFASTNRSEVIGFITATASSEEDTRAPEK